MRQSKSNCAHGLKNRTKVLAAALVVFSANVFALDKNGNFESKQEQDAFIASTLKKMAGEMN